MNNNLIRISVFIFCVFLAGVLHAGNPAVGHNNQAIGKVKPVNYDFLSSGRLNLSTYNNFKRIFQSTAATPPIYSQHYIAPAPWQYWSKANQIVITTESTTPVSGTITKSDGTHLYDFTCSAGNPFVKIFDGRPGDLPVNTLNNVISGAGLFVIANNGSIAVNLRNIASDDLGNDGDDANIKGNASLFSFGDAGIGTAFRVGYYRDGDLAGSERPIYSIMALDDDTEVKIAGLTKAVLNKGQSYLFQCEIGTLVESTRSTVMNTSARLDAPGGCGDGAYNPIPPIVSLGSEYVIVRGEGNPIAEQTTIVATEANTAGTIEYFNDNGNLMKTEEFVITQAGGTKNFAHGFYNGAYNSVSNTGKYSSSRIVTTKNVVVFSGTAGASGGAGCEVDVATLIPIANCAGSRTVETAEFTDYRAGKLPYFGYILTKSSDEIRLTTKGGSTAYTSTNIESIPGIVKRPLGSSGLFLVKFTDANIGLPQVITISSNSRLTVSMVQQSNAFSMSNFISRFPEKASQPTVSQTDCATAVLTTQIGSLAYKWYLNGIEIPGATSNTYTATVSGNYTVSSMLDCGLSAQSLPLIISLCSIDRAIEKTVDKLLPELGETVTFKLTAKNLGTGDAIGVSVTDKLPAGYEYVTHSPSAESYNSTTGVWTIGDLASGASSVLEIKAKVLTEGQNTNTATITGTQPDANPTNDIGEASTNTELGVITLISPAADRSVCTGTTIEEIVYSIGGGASGVTVTDLPAGFTSTYNSTTKELKINGSSTTPTEPAGVIYTVTSTGGIPVKKTGKIIIKADVSSPVFSDGLTISRCVGSGNDTYSATAQNSDGIAYELTPATAGSIERTTGLVTWSPSFEGGATITAIATGCNEKRSELQVTINPRPAAPGTAHLEYCQNQTGVQVLTARGETNAIFTWYDASGNVLDPGIPPSTSKVGTITYYVTQKIGMNGCESLKSPLTVTINPLPDAPGASAVTYCQNETNIPALKATGDSLTWYDSNGTRLSAAPIPTTSSAGETRYYVTQKNDKGCEGLKAELKVTVIALPLAPVTEHLTYCHGQQYIPVLTADGSNLTWYDANDTRLNAAPVPSTLSAGETFYYVTQKNDKGCEGPKAELKVTVIDLPTTPGTKPLTYCQDQQNILALTADGEKLKWYDEQGNLLERAPIPSTSLPGIKSYYVTQSNSSGCESAKAKIEITIIAKPGKPTISASGPVMICQGGSVVLKSSPADFYQWFKDGVALNGENTQTLNVTQSGKYSMVTRNSNDCISESSDLTIVNVIPIPQKPVITHQGALNICEGNTVVLKSSVAEGNQWFRDGILIPNATAQTYAAKEEGKYSVSVNTLPGCASPVADPVSITVNQIEEAPVVNTQSDLVICKGGTATLRSSASTGNQWYKDGVLIPGAVGATYIAGSSGKYTVRHKNLSGCESPSSNAIDLAEQAFKISLDANTNVASYGSKVILKVGSNLKYKILSWSPSNLFQNVDARSQTIVLEKDLKITINAVSENGCLASATVAIQVKKTKDLYIPNTFTPNGDGKNDVIKVYGTAIEMIEWAVYSQWGQLIYKSKAQDAAWDGTFRGVMQPVGVYVYKCVVRFEDGEEITRHGSINLVR